jgi:geranylgeranyl diphosphate synthase type II
MCGQEMTVPGSMETFLARGVDRAGAFGDDYLELWHSMDRASQGGKRFRPALVRRVYHALGGRDELLAAQVGDAIELLHTALVMHDDVIDHDGTRRGRLNVSGTFAERARAAGARPEQADMLGQTAGILAGDLALVGATRLLATVDTDRRIVRRLLELMEDAVCATTAGELADVQFSLHLDEVSLGQILTMEEHKTAVYSFELPMIAGAVLADASDVVLAHLSELGRLLGIAFQLRDDLQGVFGQPAATGKSTLTDLREGKMTPLIAHARTTPQWSDIETFFGDRELSDSRGKMLRERLTACGSRRFIETLADSYLSAAIRIAPDLELPTNFVRWLTDLTVQLARPDSPCAQKNGGGSGLAPTPKPCQPSPASPAGTSASSNGSSGQVRA